MVTISYTGSERLPEGYAFLHHVTQSIMEPRMSTPGGMAMRTLAGTLRQQMISSQWITEAGDSRITAIAVNYSGGEQDGTLCRAKIVWTTDRGGTGAFSEFTTSMDLVVRRDPQGLPHITIARSKNALWRAPRRIGNI